VRGINKERGGDALGVCGHEPSDAELAENLWQEAERLREEAKEMMQLSMEKSYARPRSSIASIFMTRSSQWIIVMRSGAGP